MSLFSPSTPMIGFNIPVPSGWSFIDKGTECIIENRTGEAVKFKLNARLDSLHRYCVRWEVFEEDYGTGATRLVRRGYRHRTDGVLEWLVNLK